MKAYLFAVAALLAAAVAAGWWWFFTSGAASPVGFGWYLFSFTAGLTMIVLPCTLPLAFVIVPLSMGKGIAKGLGIAAAFGLGVTLTLSAYGVAAALVGEYAIATLGAPLETVKNWLYLFAGAAAYLFALGEIGLISVRMPTYSGSAPAFIQRQQDVLKALLLGLFLGNIGVGCPHPATPVILTRIASSGDVLYGWLLFFVHAAGRVLPLLLLALLAVSGVNALQWLVARKEKIERATGWGMVFVAAFILVLGLFSHDWWVISGQHTLLESVTQEEYITGLIARQIGVGAPHTHEMPTGTGLFGLPLALGTWVLVLLWILPLFWYHLKKKREEDRAPAYRLPFFIALSVALALAFIYVLPDRFYHARADMPMDMPAMGMPRGHDAAEYHEETEVRAGIVTMLNVTPVPADTGTSTRMEFFVRQRPAGTPVTDLDTDHEKMMHVIGVRDDLTEFFHIHPDATQTPGLFAADHAFQKPGQYAVWSEITKDGARHAFRHADIAVAGAGPVHEKSVVFSRSAAAGNYEITADYAAPLIAGRESDISFDLHDAAGREAATEPYLGETMHLVVVSEDLQHFIHAHPDDGMRHDEDMHRSAAPALIRQALAHGQEPVMMGEDADEKTEFHITFPAPGVYKLFAQFRPAGSGLAADEALTAAFWVRVEETRPFALSGWWTALLVSLAAMGVLSIGVHAYLKTDHE